jgi:hypothetical protein
MMFRLVPFRTVPLRDRLQAARLMAVAPALLGLGLYGLALRDPVRAASSPDPIPDTKQNSSLLSDPAAAMASIANHLDQNAGSVVVTVESMPITQGDVAGVVRTLPVSFASLGPPEVFRRALDIMIRQKVMVLMAEKLHLDKDPAVVMFCEVRSRSNESSPTRGSPKSQMRRSPMRRCTHDTIAISPAGPVRRRCAPA